MLPVCQPEVGLMSLCQFLLHPEPLVFMVYPFLWSPLVRWPTWRAVASKQLGEGEPPQKLGQARALSYMPYPSVSLRQPRRLTWLQLGD